MNLPSHFLMTAGLEKALPRVPMVKSAFLIGSIAPDIPLWLLSIGGMVYYHPRLENWLCFVIPIFSNTKKRPFPLIENDR